MLYASLPNCHLRTPQGGDVCPAWLPPNSLAEWRGVVGGGGVGKGRVGWGLESSVYNSWTSAPMGIG
jgi:hypothetical protein